MMFFRKKKKISVPAYIVSTHGNDIVVEIEADNIKYKKGQIATAIVSTKQKAFRGKMVDVSDVIAQGPITDIKGKNITIRSNSNNLLISRKATIQAKKNNAQVRVKVF